MKLKVLECVLAMSKVANFRFLKAGGETQMIGRKKKQNLKTKKENYCDNFS